MPLFSPGSAARPAPARAPQGAEVVSRGREPTDCFKPWKGGSPFPGHNFKLWPSGGTDNLLSMYASGKRPRQAIGTFSSWPFS